ncbi:MAG: AsmA family protein [Bacteroidales bacterium]|nr:AsmA family protein [Bacteroidales bacterium]
MRPTSQSPRKHRPLRLVGAILIVLLKAIGWTFVALFLLGIGMWRVGVWLASPGVLTPVVENAANELLEADIALGQARLDLLSQFPRALVGVDTVSVTTRDIRFPKRPMLKADAIRAFVDLKALLRGRVHITRVDIEHPKLDLIVNGEQFANYDILPPTRGSSGAELELTLDHLSVNGAEITYRNPRFGSHPITGRLSAEITFHKMPQIYIRSLDLGTEGIDVNINGAIHPMPGHTLINSRLQAKIIAEELPPWAAAYLPGNAAGTVTLATRSKGLVDMHHLRNDPVDESVRVTSGRLDVANPFLIIPAKALYFNGQHIALSKDPQNRIRLWTDSTSLTIGKFGLTLGHTKAQVNGPYEPYKAYKTYKGHNTIPVAVAARFLDIQLTNGAHLLWGNTKLRGTVRPDSIRVKADLTTQHFAFVVKGNVILLDSGTVHLTTVHDPKPLAGAKVISPIDSSQSALQIHLDKSMYDLVHDWRWNGQIEAKSGQLIVPAMPQLDKLGPVALTFTPRDVTIPYLNLLTPGGSDIRLSGVFSADSGQVMANLALQGKMLNIDELSPQKTASRDTIGKVATRPLKTKSDVRKPPALHSIKFSIYSPKTRSALIPSNVTATVKFAFDSARCGDIDMTDVNGLASLAGGTLSLNGLHALTPMGDISIRGSYQAPQADSLAFAIATDAHEIPLDKIKSLIPMSEHLTPYITDLDGVVDASLRFQGELTPEMALRPESLAGDILIEAPYISFSPSPTLSRVKRWLLYHDRHFDHLDSVTAHLTLADQRFTLLPTTLAFADYRLDLQGYSTFQGNYFFHIGVEKWWLPVKFGINIAGELGERPRFHLAGERYHAPKCLEYKHRFNLIDQLNDALHRL